MAETSVGYKCPNCSAPLTFLPGHDKVTCEYCGTELEVKTIEEMYAAKEAAAAKAQAASLQSAEKECCYGRELQLTSSTQDWKCQLLNIRNSRKKTKTSNNK